MHKTAKCLGPLSKVTGHSYSLIVTLNSGILYISCVWGDKKEERKEYDVRKLNCLSYRILLV